MTRLNIVLFCVVAGMFLWPLHQFLVWKAVEDRVRGAAGGVVCRTVEPKALTTEWREKCAVFLRESAR